MGMRFSVPIVNGHEAHPAFCSACTGSFLWVQEMGQGAETEVAMLLFPVPNMIDCA